MHLFTISLLLSKTKKLTECPICPIQTQYQQTQLYYPDRGKPAPALLNWHDHLIPVTAALIKGQAVKSNGQYKQSITHCSADTCITCLITCTSHVLHASFICTCTSHVLHAAITCTSHVLYMPHSHDLHMYFTCIPHKRRDLVHMHRVQCNVCVCVCVYACGY